MKLLTVGNPKTVKGQSKGYLTAILHLAPADMSGRNVCPMASPGCRAACLNTAGRGGMFKGVKTSTYTGAALVSAIRQGTIRNKIQSARLQRTAMFYDYRDHFFKLLVRDIRAAERLARKHGLKLAVRLNGTSDLPWERLDMKTPGYMGMTIFEAFPNVQFYDYTKRPNRGNLPKNYHLTFSLSETNDNAALFELLAGRNVAVVFHIVPKTFMGAPVINGDETDLRFLDPKQDNGAGVIVGLKAKGKAKSDTTGFVR